jgi:uncharacterized protein DUF2459
MNRRRFARYLAGVLAAFLVFAIVFPTVYAAVTPERLPATEQLPAPAPGAYHVFVVDWGYHTAIVVEQPRSWRLGPPGKEAAAFLEYAWGDRRFYLESDFRPHAVFATLFLPTESVLYLDGRPDPPSTRGARATMERTIDADTLRALLTELDRSVRRTSDGSRMSPYPPAAGYSGRFYPAYGEYLWTRNCNWWTVARLGTVGLAGRAAGVVLTAQVPGRLHGFTRQ